MVAKITFIFLVMFTVSTLASTSEYESYGEFSSAGGTVQAQLDFYTAVAERIYNTMAKFLQANLNVFLWIKKTLLMYALRAFAYINYFLANNSDFISNLVKLSSEIVRTWLAAKPNIVVPVVVPASSSDSYSSYGQRHYH